MEPTLFKGDRFVVDDRYYNTHPVKRDDLVIFRRQNSLWLKRVVAVAGDTIEGKEHKTVLNGHILDEPYILRHSKPEEDSTLDTFGPVRIPAGRFFVMGDNRDMSFDSRDSGFGLIDVASIAGRPLYGYHIIDKPIWWDLK